MVPLLPGHRERQEVGLRLHVLLGVEELPHTVHISEEGAEGPGRSPASSLRGQRTSLPCAEAGPGSLRANAGQCSQAPQLDAQLCPMPAA